MVGVLNLHSVFGKFLRYPALYATCISTLTIKIELCYARRFYKEKIASASSFGVDTIWVAPFSFKNSVDLNPQFTLMHGIPAFAAV